MRYECGRDGPGGCRMMRWAVVVMVTILVVLANGDGEDSDGGGGDGDDDDYVGGGQDKRETTH